MNHTRMQSVIEGLTGTARKVYDAVPMLEGWDTSQILAEMRRAGNGFDMARFHGCLKSLIESGLIVQSAGKYRRVKTKKPEEKPATTATRIRSETMPKPEDPMDELAGIAAELRGRAAALNELADRIESAALNVASSIESAKTGEKKLNELAGLLKGIVS